MAMIRRRRLEHCRAHLLRPELRCRPLHSIAISWGFTREDVFGRAFRDACGMSPRDSRQSAARAVAGLPRDPGQNDTTVSPSCPHDERRL
ncbi:helix-turn-helix domain-containing protein [Streptomyces jumonjinensis]|uniref:helix-turn-helix domain-containing protein n=1 Tax=Streptomyces jumonjinensis TaxID=1945 RepID=UPI00331B5138